MAGERDITFLFTDMVGSTRLWNRAQSTMHAAVERHDELLRDIVTANNGAVFKTVGDAIFAAFPQPTDAVRAAVAAQRAILTEPWQGFDPGDTIRVRMAIHTGPAEQREGDYFGSTLNRLSRTLNAGHGGQILCTDDTVSACGEHWPDGIERRDLGARTLRDVPGSGRIFQLVAPGLPEHFPPLDTLDPRVHNLPRWPSPLVGRETEQARIRELARSGETRLLTVLGPGGVGKTRLITEAAAPLLDEFQDGIRFVDLSALRDDAQVIPAMVQVFGAADPLLDPRDALLEWLRPRTLLLVLDNCEQVIDGVATICRAILDTAPQVTILATSRTPIHIRGERQLSLEPFPLPEDEQIATDNPAVRLFTERATEVKADFALDPTSSALVANICRLLDGLPLAIELAAAWVRILSPEALHRRLQESRAMLRDGARDLPDRQRALTTTIAWSYDLLEPDDQRAFRRLAVFRGGIALDAAAAVLWDETERDPLWALSRLDALVQANLLQVTPDPTGEPRFTMLQTIQEYASGVLHTSGEWESASTSHADYFAQLVNEANSHYGSAKAGDWLDLLDREFENLRAAVESGALISQRRDSALEFVVDLAGFLEQRGHRLEEQTWLSHTYRETGTYSPDVHVAALYHLGNTWFSDPHVAEECYRKAIAIADATGDQRLRLQPVSALSTVACLVGDYETAIAMAEEVMEIAVSVADVTAIALGHLRLANAYCEAGLFDQALFSCQQARKQSREIEDFDGEAWGWLIEGRVHRRSGDSEKALSSFDRAILRFQETGDEEVVAFCRMEQGLGLLDTNLEEARTCLESAAHVLVNTLDAYTLIAMLEGGARLRIGEGSHSAGVELLGAARRFREQAGIIASAVESRSNDRAAMSAILQVGQAAFERSVEDGSALSPRMAINRFIAADAVSLERPV